MPDEQGARQQQATAAQIARQALQQAHQAENQADLAGRRARRLVGHAEQIHGGKGDLARARREPPLQRRQIGGRLAAQLLLARLERRLEARPQRRETFPARRALPRPPGAPALVRRARVQRLAPPLQAHQARDRLADHAPHPGDLVIERIEGEQRFACVCRGEQRRQIAIRIMLAHHRSAMRQGSGRLLDQRACPHSIIRFAAPVRHGTTPACTWRTVGGEASRESRRCRRRHQNTTQARRAAPEPSGLGPADPSSASCESAICTSRQVDGSVPGQRRCHADGTPNVTTGVDL